MGLGPTLKKKTDNKPFIDVEGLKVLLLKKRTFSGGLTCDQVFELY